MSYSKRAAKAAETVQSDATIELSADNALEKMVAEATHEIKHKLSRTAKAEIFGDIEIPEHLYRLTPKQAIVVLMLAKGDKFTEIAKATGFTPATISRLAKRPEIVEAKMILALRLGFSAINDEFKKLLPRALEVTRDIMFDPQVHASTRLDAAGRIIERVLGKATQPVEHSGSMLKDLIGQLDSEHEADFAREMASVVSETAEIDAELKKEPN